MHIFTDFFGPLPWVVVIVAVVIFFFRSRFPRDDERHARLALSREDTVGQLFILLSLFFLGITLLAFNDSFGGFLTKRMILFVVSVVGLIVAYRLRAVYALAFSLAGLVVWWAGQSFQWLLLLGDMESIKFSAIFVGMAFWGIVFYGLGRLHGREARFRRFAMAYLLMGSVIVTGLLFLFSTKLGVGLIGWMTKGLPFFGSWQLVLTLLVLFALAVATTLYGAAQKLLSVPETVGVLILVFLFGTIVLLPEQVVSARVGLPLSERPQLTSTGYFWALVYNIAVFFELVGLVLAGYAHREPWLINLGSLFLFMLIIVKYFDWFFTFLDKSIFFIGAGVLLFAFGWLMERGRRYVISNIIKEQTGQNEK